MVIWNRVIWWSVFPEFSFFYSTPFTREREMDHKNIFISILQNHWRCLALIHITQRRYLVFQTVEFSWFSHSWVNNIICICVRTAQSRKKTLSESSYFFRISIHPERQINFSHIIAETLSTKSIINNWLLLEYSDCLFVFRSISDYEWLIQLLAFLN